MLKKITEQLSALILWGTKFLVSKFVRRTLYSFSIVAILVGIFLVASPAKAEFLQDVANGIINGLSYILIEIAAIFIQITIFSLKFFIEIAGYNNFIDADIVKLGWNMIRDVANMFFVVFLLVIAFGTILGLEQYEWKKTLIKLVMSAFLVNFSNLICQLIIDVAQVFTITFLNAVAGAAGGNLIKMFNLDEIYNIANNNTDPNGLQIKLFGGAVMTIVFAGMAMFTMGAYLVIIIARMVVLWALMIFSPLAFLFAALPNTQQYAKQFWDKFVSHVIAAPVMVFFLWLAFATFGGGNVVQENIEREHPLIVSGGIQPITQSTDNNGAALGITYSQAASWENMANFAVAIAFLAFGIQQVSSLGVVGGGLVSGAINFGKNVATIASGYAVGRWLVGKGRGAVSDVVGGAAKGLGKGIYTATLANTVEIAKNRVNREIEGWKSWRAFGPKPKLENKKAEAKGASDEWQSADLVKGEGIDAKGKKIKRDAQTGNWYQVDDNGSWLYQRDVKTGRVLQDFQRDADGRVQFEDIDTRGSVQKWFYNRQERLVKSRKNLEKVQKQKDIREQLMDKRVTAAPKYAMQRFEGMLPDAYDRMEQGMLSAETMRSAAKTAEFKALGEQLVLSAARFKDGRFQNEKPSIEQQVVQHKEAAARTEELIKEGQARARRDYIQDKQGRGGKGAKILEGKIRAELETRALGEQSKTLETISTTNVLKNNTDILDREIEAKKSAITYDLEKQELEKALEVKFLRDPEVQKDLLKEAEYQQSIDSGNAAIKRFEAEASKRAAETGEATILNKLREEKIAHTAEERRKQIEKRVEREFYEHDPHGKEELLEDEQIQMQTVVQDEVIKQLRSKARLDIINGKEPGKADFDALVESQSVSKVLADALSSTEKSKVNDAMLERMKDGKEAQEKLNEILLNPNLTQAQKDKAIEDAIAEATKQAASYAFAYAAAKAKEGESQLALGVKHNDLLSASEQNVIYGKRGIVIPSTALTEPIEKYAREYADMKYEQFVYNLGGAFRSMVERRQSGEEISDADKAKLAGLLSLGQKENWIDDGIWKFMGDDVMKKEMADAFDWKDMEFNYDKINDIMSMFAVGADMEFSKIHHKVGKGMDYAVKVMEMGVGGFMKKLFEKSFSADEKKKLQESGGFDVDGIDVDFYRKQLEENQAQIQFIANLRDRAAASSHPENGGHGQFVDLGEGKYMYVLTGAKVARDSVMGEVRKLGITTRAAMQTHATANLDEGTGFVTEVREEDMRDIRGQITSGNDYRNTNERFDIQMLGLSSNEDKTEYKDTDGKLMITGTRIDKKTGSRVDAKRVDWVGKRVSSEQIKKIRDFHAISEQQAKKQATVNDIVNNIFAKRMAAGAADFLLTMGKASGLTDMQSLEGKMNLKLLVGGEEREITHFNDLVELYNSGQFSFDGKPPSRELSRYSPRDAGRPAA